MATLKVSNSDGSIAEFDVLLYKKEKNAEIPHYSYNNDMLTQKVTIAFCPGETREYYYPLRYKEQIQSVVLSTCEEQVKPYIRIYDWQLDHFSVTILPCGVTTKSSIEVTAIGF